MRKHIFNAGPAVLPEEVLQQASEAVVDLHASGMSVLEISHRATAFDDILREAQSLVKELMGLGEDYSVLFLQGGASLQFSMLPMNLLSEEDAAGYADTGTWSVKAIKEARLFGQIHVLASSKQDNYRHIPKGYTIPDNLKYFHITTNNTIFGTQYHTFPDAPVPLIADMSSDILCRKMEATRFDFIYAGAQKNLGPAGVTLVIIKQSLLNLIRKTLPSMLDYRVHVENNSLYNTPCVFGIYVCLLTLRWLKSKGLDAIEALNKQKASLIYSVIDRYPLFSGHAVPEDRSLMNITFTLTKPELESQLLEETKKAGITGIKGHRSVGGFRASVYNALPLKSVSLLCEIMEDFGKKYS
ncbi:MAG: phosphoserine aminotransferase [Chitinophagales bacterium]|nr:MAG: phosphoserine aminotransferase [Chitinophagales bacterium]